MVSSPTSVKASTTCPRCGYDLRGVIATWTESCPLTGTCSECGLEFEWARLLVPRKFEPLWCIEFVPRVRHIPLASFQTFGRSFLPSRFWTRLQMSFGPRPRRLLLYAAFPLFVMLLVYVAAQSFMAIAVWNQTTLGAQRVWRDAAIRLTVYQRDLAAIQGGQARGIDERRRDMLIDQYQRNIATLQQALASPPSEYITISPAFATLEAVFLPFARRSKGIVLYPTGPEPYVAPAALHAAPVAGLLRSSTPLAETVRLFSRTIGLTWLAVATLIVLPLTMPLLKTTLRRAKVRPVHLLRICAYSMWIPTTALILCAGLALLVHFTDSITHRALLITEYIMTAGVWITLIAWWRAAVAHYLKVPHAFTVALLHAILAIVLVLGIAFLIDNMFIIDLMERLLPRRVLRWL